MKTIKIAVAVLVGQFLILEQTFAGTASCLPGDDTCIPGTVVPEMDGSFAIIALALVAGVVALVRERFFRK